MSKIAVIGAGTMGNGIAHVFSQYGFSVRLIDQQPAQLEKAMLTIAKNLDRQEQKGTLTAEEKKSTLARIKPVANLLEGVADTELIIEAATENRDIKMNIFRQLDDLAPADTILATNTSSISITQLAAATRRPSHVIGMHFMNPVPVMKLVEIINGFSTDTTVTEKIVGLTKTIGKIPCIVNDSPGFISNRILLPMINEAILSLQEGVATVESIDTIMKTGMAHPMGPLQLADFIGLDVCLAILRVLQEEIGNPKYAPCTLLVNMVAAGLLGVKSGKGFYDYSGGSKTLVVNDKFKSDR
jgi:3-hydroxybutyryl-CoA dehydrogenase